MSLGEPFITAASEFLTAFGIPSDLASILAILICVVFVFFLFANIVNSFSDGNMSTNPYLLVIFFVSICALGFVPMWILFAVVLVGITYLLLSHLIGGG